jgi:hypothetical protein
MEKGVYKVSFDISFAFTRSMSSQGSWVADKSSKDPRWSNPDLDPVKPEDRTWGAVVSLTPNSLPRFIAE